MPTPMPLAPQARPLYGWPFLAVLALALAYTLDLTRRLAHFNLIFWDAKVYARAIHAFATGADPYTRSPDLNFIYAPGFLVAGSLLSHLFPAHTAWHLYLLLNGAAVFLIPILLARFYLHASWFTPAVALGIFFFHPLLTAQTAFTSGNICSLLYAIVLAAGVPGLRRHRWLWFYLAVGCASLIKPTFLAFLLLPLLLSAAQILPCILTVAVVGIEVFLERILMPARYHDFLGAVYFQVVTLGDTGFGLLSRLQPIAAHVPVLHQKAAYLASAAILIALVYGLWKATQPARDSASKSAQSTAPGIPHSIWIAAILVSAILANLRLLAYDADIAILPAVFILVESLHGLLTRKVSSLAIALPIAIFTVILAKDPKTALLLFLLASVLLALARIPRMFGCADSDVPGLVRPEERPPSTLPLPG